jgi:uncharacterized protein
MIEISKDQARRFLLAYQDLLPPHQLNGKNGILDFIQKVGCIQFDPIDIVGQNSDLVLQSRIANYHQLMLRTLLYQDRRLLDGWDKNMSIYLVEDWPYFQRLREKEKLNTRSMEEIRSVLEVIRSAIEERGPISSIELEIESVVDWSWAPIRLARAALESMYFWGELIIHHRINTRRVYDFSKRHIPQDLLLASDPNRTEEQYRDWYVLRRITSVGLIWNRAGDAWLGMSGIKSQERLESLKRLLEQERVCKVIVEGINYPFFARNQHIRHLQETTEEELTNPQAAVIAPLDNLMWDRRLIKELFNFEYRWEVYKPASQRSYGYYVLPVLYGDKFVARFEPARDRKISCLIVKNWWWEPDVVPSEDMKRALQSCFQRFLVYLGADNLEVEQPVQRSKHMEWLLQISKL